VRDLWRRPPDAAAPNLERQPAERDRSEWTLGRVLGRVRLWGTVVGCSQGWRSSHAYPERIYVSSAAHKAQLLDGEQLAWKLAVYGVPVEVIPCAMLSELAKAIAEKA
jgi:hypothetical protein